MRESPNKTISASKSASSGLELLHMVLELDTDRSASENAGLQGGGLWDLILVGEGNDAFLIRVWKPLPNRRVLKP